MHEYKGFRDLIHSDPLRLFLFYRFRRNDSMNDQHNNRNPQAGSNERRTFRAYRDPTADMAIAHVMREERMKRKAKQRKADAFHR